MKVGGVFGVRGKQQAYDDGVARLFEEVELLFGRVWQR